MLIAWNISGKSWSANLGTTAVNIFHYEKMHCHVKYSSETQEAILEAGCILKRYELRMQTVVTSEQSWLIRLRVY